MNLITDKIVRTFNKNKLIENLNIFQCNFNGKSLYAIKVNPSHHILSTMIENGIKDFDAASLKEIETIYKLSNKVNIHYLHPIKPRSSIYKAYFDYNIRTFSLDSIEEFYKILECTNYATDLTLIIRLSIENNESILPLSNKFGADYDTILKLLDTLKPYCNKIGISFHVGSQCMNPLAFKDAIDKIKQINYNFDIIDVGGGFPCEYPFLTAPPLENYFNIIHNEIKSLPNNDKIELWGEPGRVLVANCETVIVRVIARKNDILYINDGTYGGLYDAGNGINFIFPAKLYNRISDKGLIPFKFYGPTCDSADYINNPYMLPSDIEEGDYIEFSMLGSYSSTMKTAFNGFETEELIML